MRRLLLPILIAFFALLGTPDRAQAQCNGQFGAGQVCGSVAGGLPGPVNLGGSPTVFNVKSAPCNATGNGSTDDTAAINTCIASFNSAGNGVLYFPAGTYKTTAALTAITANGIVKGDGITNLSGVLGNNAGVSPKYSGVAALPATLIESSSTTAQLFTVNSQALLFSDLSLLNTSGTPPTAGSGITVASTAVGQKVDYQNVEVSQFYIGIDIQTGNGWSMSNVFIVDPVLYGVKVRNTVDPDYGDWSINNFMVWLVNRSPTDGIRLENSGGGKIVNFKINGGGSQNSGGTGQQTFTNGIEIATSASTSDLFITNGSIEWFSGTGIKIAAGAFAWPNITLSNIEIFSGISGTFTSVISLSNINYAAISNIIFPLEGATPTGPPIALSTVTNVNVSGLVGFPANPFVGGSVPDHDGTSTVGGNINIPFQYANGGGWFWADPNAAASTFVSVFSLTAPNVALGSSIALNMGFANSPGNWMTQYFNYQGSGLGNNGYVFQFNNAANPDLNMFYNGHVSFQGGNGGAPTLSAGCNGAGSSVTGSDIQGTVTGQTAVATTCTLSFGAGFISTPFCMAVGNTAPLTGAITPSTSTLVVNFPSTANFKWSYHCFGT